MRCHAFGNGASVAIVRLLWSVIIDCRVDPVALVLGYTPKQLLYPTEM